MAQATNDTDEIEVQRPDGTATIEYRQTAPGEAWEIRADAGGHIGPWVQFAQPSAKPKDVIQLVRKAYSTRYATEDRLEDLPGGITTDPDENERRALFRVLAKQTDTGQSELLIHEPFRGPDEADLFALRLRDPENGGESEIGGTYEHDAFCAYLRGLIDGARGEIAKKADRHRDD
jgi:hypothetical protein